MDARFRPIAAGLLAIVLSSGAAYPTPNFVIHCSDPQLAKELGDAAEVYRKELAQLWLGKTLPDWSRPCPVRVEVGPNLGAGGATTFVFDRGEVYGWQMTIQGSRQRLLDSVLPHEITHMILASHFRQPLPRWADEGAATTVEHISEREKHRRMLLEFLRTQRGISFRRMFAMQEYPRDIMPLYAQGYTLAEFLIQQGGHQRFIKFLETGLTDNQWETALAQWYGYQDLGQLQTSWITWVAQGFPQQSPQPVPASEPSQEPQLVAIQNQWRRASPVAASTDSIYQRSPNASLNSNSTGAGSSEVIPASYLTLAGSSGGVSDIPQTTAESGRTLDVGGWRPAPLAAEMAAASQPYNASFLRSQPQSEGTSGCGCGQPNAAVQANQVAHPRTEAPGQILLDWNRNTPWR